MRTDLIGSVREVLARAGYYVSEESPLRPVSFDLLARRDSHLLIVKVLTNVDSFSEAAAQEMRLLSRFLGGTCLLVGERSSSRDLELGAVYERHGVRILNYETFHEFMLEGVPPLVYAAPGGFYVTLDGSRLRSLREERGISLGQLAEAAGVSRRAISMYEEGMGAMVEVAQRIEAFLEEAIVEPVDPLEVQEGAGPGEVVVDLARLKEGLEREVYALMAGMGFRVVPFRKSPVNAITAKEEAPGREDRPILTGVIEGEADVLRRARAVANFSAVAETYCAFFVERRTSTRLSIEGTPLIGKDELSRLDDPAAVLDLIAERRRRKR